MIKVWHRRTLAAWLGAVGLLGAAASAAIGPSGVAPAELRFPHASSSWIGDDWSLILRLVPASDQDDATVLRLDTPETLVVDRRNGSWSVTLQGQTGPIAIATPASPLRVGELTLLAVDFTAANGTLRVMLRDAGMTEPAIASATIPGFAPLSSTQVMLYGNAGAPPFDGDCDMLFRDHTLTVADVERLWTRRLVVDPLRGDLDRPKDHPIFDNMPGPTISASTTPVVLAVGHSMTSLTRRGYSGGANPTPAVPGRLLSPTNTVIYDRTRFPGPTSFFYARNVMTVAGLRYVAPHGLFGDRGLTGILEGPFVVPNAAPLLRGLARGEAPEGLKRIIFTANSRAVRSFDGMQRPGGLYAGFMEARKALVAGMASFRGDSVGRAPIETSTALNGLFSSARTNYTRACSYGQSANPGPGSPGLIGVEGGFLEMGFKEYPGSLFTADAPITVRALMLRYPGSAGVLPRRVTQVSSSSPRVFVDQPTETLSNTAFESTAEIVGDRSVAVPGDATSIIKSGWLVSVVAGATPGGLNQVESMTFDGQRTFVTLRHVWDTFPTPGDTVAFGPFEYMSITVEHEGNTAPIRGLRLQYDSAQPGLPVCVVSWETWRPGVNGYIIGAHGTGGAGYSKQLAEGFAGMHSKLLTALDADAVCISTANQDPDPSPFLSDMIDEVERVPGLEIVLLGDARFPQPEVNFLQFVNWHVALREQASARRYAFATILESPEVGSGWDMLEAGEMDDGAHPNFDGNIRQAAALLGMLVDAALPVCPGDTNADNVVNFADLNAVLAVYGDSGHGLPADLNNDGLVDFADLNEVLANFALSCD